MEASQSSGTMSLRRATALLGVDGIRITPSSWLLPIAGWLWNWPRILILAAQVVSAVLPTRPALAWRAGEPFRRIRCRQDRHS